MGKEIWRRKEKMYDLYEIEDGCCSPSGRTAGETYAAVLAERNRAIKLADGRTGVVLQSSFLLPDRECEGYGSYVNMKRLASTSAFSPAEAWRKLTQSVGGDIYQEYKSSRPDLRGWEKMEMDSNYKIRQSHPEIYPKSKIKVM